MRILGIKPGHDGAYALVEDGRLVWSLEAEKDSGPRHGPITPELTLAVLERLDAPPDVVALGGWFRLVGDSFGAVGAGYLGADAVDVGRGRWSGQPVRRVSTSHERSHLLASLALAPGAPLDDAAVLVWEGVLGSLYRWRGPRRGVECFPVLDQPGARYASLFALADPAFPARGADPPLDYAGKMMALVGTADGRPPSRESRAVVDHLLRRPRLHPLAKRDYRTWPGYDAGVETDEFARAAAHLSDRLFTRFAEAAAAHLPRGLPLVIGGGCGLNCAWNRRWLEHGWFTDVFVPPCPDDSGAAIGAAVGAWVAEGGDCRLEWSVYSGAEFVDPDARRPGWSARPFAADALADVITAGEVVAWVQGRCEIGPRALGHRSLLADPRHPRSTARLNEIKGREAYRPVAPVCRAEAADALFAGPRLDPHMLYFSTVRQPARLPAVTHRDGTARVQALAAGAVPRLDQLLVAFERVAGVPVLCNTSLNFTGRGFINRSDDLFAYCEAAAVRHAVVDGTWHERAGAP